MAIGFKKDDRFPEDACFDPPIQVEKKDAETNTSFGSYLMVRIATILAEMRQAEKQQLPFVATAKREALKELEAIQMRFGVVVGDSIVG